MSSLSSSSASASAPPPHVVEDCLGVVQLLSDGTVTRPTRSFLSDPPVHDVRRDLPVQWKDVVYDEAHRLRLRMYRPTTSIGLAGGGEKKLPVLVYFHGGGFCIASFEHPSFHAVALRIAHDLPAIVLSADYRLAPEHRLPAAHHDAETVLSWLHRHAVAGSAADAWLAESADFGRVFVWGDSSGGNISHHIAVRYGSGGLDINPVRIAGCVLLGPYFGGEERMASEACSPADVLMSLALFDQMWRLALPAGATRDHPAANPFGPESAPLDDVAFPPVLVLNAEHDLLRDRTADYVARLKAMGKPVELVEFDGQEHAFFVYEPWGAAADGLIRVVRQFVHGGAPDTAAALSGSPELHSTNFFFRHF
ncbi:strigolactones hydrolase CXE15 [Aegilops tauschii subsp. strangulata]|uniref:Alpha/beta hydrolase fold-3 domain-containing protein n=1 Tax=Aegilops tauschii subsp. strangulata TaxID=200361 RepID=A0A453PIH2_AEGTS|nr:probable carboxylesterase 15 [Aegilops tauschii subsp. strangulata]